MSKKKIENKYEFPLFVRETSTDYILRNKKIRVADVWSFWDYVIRTYAQRTSGVNKFFLFSLLEQARYFYQVAEGAPMHSQSLLYYYSFLNLSKIVINLHNYLGDRVEYFHGVECNISSTTTFDDAELKIKEYAPARNRYSVAYELMNLMGDTFTPPKPFVLKVKDALRACVGIHRTYSETTSGKEIYHRLKEPTLYKDGSFLIFESEIKNCTHDLFLSLQRHYNIECKKYGKCTKYMLKEKFNMNHYHDPNRSDYFELSKQIMKKGIWTYTDGEEYRMYITDNVLRYSSASIIYNIMFFLGSITRYHPYLFENLLTGKNLWMVSEFLKTQPMQFLHLVTSHTIGAVVLKP